MKLVATGDIDTVLSKFPGREKEYILWWLIDIDKIPDSRDIKDIAELFVDHFAFDGKLEYKASFVSGFHDDITKSRSWGLLKK